MKKFLYPLLLLFPVLLNGQSCDYYFNLDQGNKLIYHQLDKKDKLSSIMEYEITSLEQGSDQSKAVMKTVVKDKKDELITEAEMELICEDGIFYIDMKSYLSPEMMESYKDMDITMKGDKLGIPENLSAGDELEDGSLNMLIKSSGIKIADITITVSDRKVEAREDVTVPAGTFNCNKISSTTTTDMMFEIETKSVEWVSPEIGMVKSESYDKKERKSGTTILQEIKK